MHSRPAPRHSSAVALLAALGIVAALFIGGRQAVAVGLIPHPWDKLAHAGIFALLACAIGLSSNRRGGSRLAIAFLGALLVGALDEWHQMFLPGREADASDFIADLVGSISGTVLLAMKGPRSLPALSAASAVSAVPGRSASEPGRGLTPAGSAGQRKPR